MLDWISGNFEYTGMLIKISWKKQKDHTLILALSIFYHTRALNLTHIAVDITFIKNMLEWSTSFTSSPSPNSTKKFRERNTVRQSIQFFEIS